MSTMYTHLRLKRGRRRDLPSSLPIGEPVFCYDTGELFVGMGETEPPKLIHDNSKWFREHITRALEDEFGEVTEEEYLALTGDWSLNMLMSSCKNLKFEVFYKEPEEFAVELGRFRTNRGPMVNTLKPKVVVIKDDVTGDVLKKTEVHLGTDKEPFVHVWIGEHYLDGTTGYNTLPNNFLEQWGRIYAPANAIIRVDLPIAYPTPNYSLQYNLKSEDFPSSRIVTISPGAFELQVKSFNAEILWRTVGRG